MTILRALRAVRLLTAIRQQRPDLWRQIQEFARERRQPEPNSFAASAWHNEALARAREKLGSGADLSEVLQEAARIQQAR